MIPQVLSGILGGFLPVERGLFSHVLGFYLFFPNTPA